MTGTTSAASADVVARCALPVLDQKGNGTHAKRGQALLSLFASGWPFITCEVLAHNDFSLTSHLSAASPPSRFLYSPMHTIDERGMLWRGSSPFGPISLSFCVYIHKTNIYRYRYLLVRFLSFGASFYPDCSFCMYDSKRIFICLFTNLFISLFIYLSLQRPDGVIAGKRLKCEYINIHNYAQICSLYKYTKMCTQTSSNKRALINSTIREK